jgi:hypothetical protein
MWQAAVGVLIGYLFALWWVRRDARKEVAQVREMYAARLESREREIADLRDSFDKSQRAVAAYERRSRYLEAAVAANVERSLNGAHPPERSARRPG